MKILRLYTRLPPLPGGMENHIAQLTKEQIKLGHDVSIYFNQGSYVTANDIQKTKIPLFKIEEFLFDLFSLNNPETIKTILASNNGNLS